jgi:HD superfamily phosphohydrolase YqeK
VAARLELPDWAVVTRERTLHIVRVVELVDRWAHARGVTPAEADRWHRAAVLHDALRDAPQEVLARYQPRNDWPPKLWHGPAAAAAARQHGERDTGVLDAIHYHSVGWAAWDDAGRMLFLADYLEPGRAHERAAREALAARVPAEPDAVLREVVRRRLAWLVEHGRPIRLETWELWNHLAAADFSSPA